MKKTIVFIIILLLIVAACMYYNCMQQEKFQQEKEEAIAAAVQDAIDSLNQRKALEIPKQHVQAHKPPPPEPTVKPEPKPEPEVEATEPNMMTDERDGQQYKIIDANGKWWMGQNLNYETEDSWCYELQSESCDQYGRLYTWNAASKACPPGWHLPNDAEWKDLIVYYGGNFYAGKNLKEGGLSGFDAVMAGYRDHSGYYGKVGESSYHWSATEQNADYASFKGIYKDVDNVGTYTYTKSDGMSVRCIKD